MDNWDKPFFRGVLRESDGTPSLSRTGTLIALLAGVLWVTLSFKVHKEIPDLKPVEAWVDGIALCLYGVNQAGSAAKHALGNTPPSSPPDQ